MIDVKKRTILVLVAALMVAGMGYHVGQKPDSEAMLDKQNPQKEVSFVAHKALYEVKMLSRGTDAQIADVSGQMFYELRQSCEEWITSHRFRLNYDYIDMPDMLVTSDFSTYEDRLSQELAYVVRRTSNQEPFQEIKGHADKATGVATYSVPDGLKYVLPDGVLFPMEHTQALIQGARQGETFIVADIFDGSEEKGALKINSFIGASGGKYVKVSGGNAEGIQGELLQTPSWKVRLAFFAVGEEREEAEYEMSIILHENGVIRDMVIDYEDFSISQKLVALEDLSDDEFCR